MAKQSDELSQTLKGLQSYNNKEDRQYIHFVDGGITDNQTDMNKSAKQPSMIASMNAMTNIQLHGYNAATADIVRNNLLAWADKLSTPEHEVKTYFIDVGFKDVPQPQLRLFLNKIPTSFSLEPNQVDSLIKSARDLVCANPEFQQLVEDISQ